MLKACDAKCMNMLDELRAIPETEELVQNIEEYDFEKAYELLINIRNTKEKLS
jgi:hypothetical protein